MAAASAERIGDVFLVRPVDDKRIEELKTDSKCVQSAFSNLGFKPSKDNREEVIEDIRALEKHLKQIKFDNGSVVMIYIIAKVVKLKVKACLEDKDSRTLGIEDVMEIFVNRKNPDTKIIIFLQTLFSSKEEGIHILYNRGPGADPAAEKSAESIQVPQNMLMVNIPENVLESSKVVRTLCDELQRTPNVESAVTSIIKTASNQKNEFIPMFSSTTYQNLCLKENWAGEGQTNVKPTLITKMRVCAWLMESFKDILHLNAENDAKLIEGTFSKLDSLIAPPIITRGKVTKQKILTDLESLERSGFLVLILSSHGSDGGHIYTYEKHITWKEFLKAIEHLKDTPKLIIRDHCRGCYESVFMGGRKDASNPRNSSSILAENLPDNTVMVFSSTEGTESFQVNKGGLLISTFCSKLQEYYNNPLKKDLFTLIHETMETVSKGKKQHPTFSSTMRDVYRFN